MELTKTDSASLLAGIDTPAKLRALPATLLPELAQELRQYLIESVAQSGGHFAAGLGAVELTVALHWVFNTPRDRLIWDVGHQAYPHKILTGRREQLGTIRQYGGLSGFPCRTESPYDAFGVAHAGTSLSAALGMAIGSALDNTGRRIVAVLGDGALTAGMVYEAMNQIGDLQANVLVVLNDNGMSIAPNVGALCKRFAPLHKGNSVGDSDALFRALGFDYHGPIDGHDLPQLTDHLRDLAKQTGPRLLHIITRKGKGYQPAEENPIKYHGVSTFDPARGLASSQTKARPKARLSYTEVFSDWLCDMAALDPRLVAITPAMREGSGLVAFAKCHPERYFDAAIAEQHAVTLGAGLACEGYKPVVAIYSSFLQRAYDQLIHDVALQNLPVLFALDRGGLVGNDGATHHGSFDLSFLRCIPNMTIMAPADENECRQMLYTGYVHEGPAAVRYPRGSGPGLAIESSLTALPLGKAELCRQGRRIAFLSFGSLLDQALEAAEQLDASVINMRFIKPLDEILVLRIASAHELLITLEDNAVMGGAGSAVNEYLLAKRLPTQTINLGLPDRFIEHGTREQLLAECGLDCSGLMRAVANYYDDTVLPLRRQRALA